MPEVLLVNPRRRRRAKATSRRKTTRRRRRVHVHARVNPIRRRVHARVRRNNPRRRRRLHRNPMHVGGNVFMKGASIAMGGLAVELLASKLATMLPASWQTNANMVRIGTKVAITVGVPLLAKKVRLIPGNIANAIALGGAVVTVVDIINTYVKPNVPFLHDYNPDVPGLQGYEAGTLTDYEAESLSGGAYGGGAF